MPPRRSPPLARALLVASLLAAGCGQGEAPGAGATPADPGAEDRAIREQLEAIGYLAGSRPAPRREGVTVHRPERAAEGLNFYTSGHAAEALLMDMQGEVLHRWCASFESLWPDSPAVAGHPGRKYFRRAHLSPNGEVIVIFEGLGIAKLDRASRPLWARALAAHHDLEVLPDGEIYVLTRETSVREGLHHGKPFLQDFVSILDAEGRQTRRISLLDALLESPYRDLYRDGGGLPHDLFHTNSLQGLDGRSAGRAPEFRTGRVLVSMPELDAIAVVDLELARVVWALRADFRYQHDPEQLAGGNLLLFDNGGSRGRSRVLEIDPIRSASVWSYGEAPGQPLFSECCGTAQRLPNGNTLVTESEAGRAFEVTPEGEIVWEFYNPGRAGEEEEMIALLPEVLRLPPGFPTGWVGASCGEGLSAPK